MENEKEYFLGIVLWADNRPQKRYGCLASLEPNTNYLFYFDKLKLDFTPQVETLVWFAIDLHEEGQQYRVTDVRKVEPHEEIPQEDLDTLANRLKASRKARHEKRQDAQTAHDRDEMYFHRQDYLRRNPTARGEYFKKTGMLIYANRFEE